MVEQKRGGETKILKMGGGGASWVKGWGLNPFSNYGPMSHSTYSVLDQKYVFRQIWLTNSIGNLK